MPAITVGRVLRERYVLEQRLGSSGHGAVFKARDRLRAMLPDSHQCVALKILSAGGDSSDELLAQWRQEFYSGQGLSHENIVNVYDLDRDGDVFFFTMELLDGESLGAVMERLRPAAIRRPQAWQLIQQLGAGLTHAHERGVVHGDLSPNTIFITREGELRITNFGAPARARLDSCSGTSAYASCEQLEGRQPDASDDVYALACLAYELLAGNHPFESRTATLARDYQVSAIRPRGLSGRQWRTLQRGLSSHRAGRSLSVRTWMHRLVGERERGERIVTPLSELTHTNNARSHAPWRAAALVFLTASLATAAFLTQSRSTSSLGIAASPGVPSAPVEAVHPPTFTGVSVPANSRATSDDAVIPTAVVDKAGSAAASSTDMPRPTSLVLSVEPSRIGADDHFAEVRLHRNQLQKGGSFSWWTEPGTAKAGVDYLPETAAVQAFPSGYLSTRVYVKLLPQPLRSHRSYFYVAISEPGHHGRPMVTRRQIWLPMASASLQARR
jgi:serine/threonine protein kinase